MTGEIRFGQKALRYACDRLESTELTRTRFPAGCGYAIITFHFIRPLQ